MSLGSSPEGTRYPLRAIMTTKVLLPSRIIYSIGLRIGIVVTMVMLRRMEIPIRQ